MLRVGVLGAGFMGATHVRAYAKLPDVEVVGVFSGTASKAAALAREVGAAPFDDAQALATDERVDAVSVALPTHLHSRFVALALGAGKHVLVEKPMALTLDECDLMINAARSNGRVLMVAHVLRFWPEYRALAELIRSGAIGRPLAATATRLCTRPDWSGWFGDPALTGGAVHDLHIHDLDLLNSLFGQPRSVYARGQRGGGGGWDHVLSTVDYGAVVATAEASVLMPPEFPFTMALRVTCERGVAEFSFRALGEQVDSAANTQLLVYNDDGTRQPLPVEPGDGYEREVAAFARAAAEGRSPSDGTAEQGRLAVQTALAARESLESGRVVEVTGDRG